VINATIALIDDPHSGPADLLAIMPGPDFPTGGSSSAARASAPLMKPGRGSVIMRGKVEFDSVRSGREAIIVTEVPYQVNKASMVEKNRRARARETHRGDRRPSRRIGPGRRSLSLWS
jgi:DNA gyrase subunit A